MVTFLWALNLTFLLGIKSLSNVVISPDDKYIFYSSDEKISVFEFPSRDGDQLSFGKLFLPPLYNCLVGPGIPKYSNFAEYDSAIMCFDKPLNQFAKNMKGFYCTPQYWTLAHYVTIFRPETLPELLSDPEFEVPFMLDCYKRTPLQYLVAHPSFDNSMANNLLEYILNYVERIAEKRSYEAHEILDSLSAIFIFIIMRMDPALVDRYLRLIWTQARAPMNNILPKYGKSETRLCYLPASTILTQTQKTLFEQGLDQITFKVIRLPLDYSINSDQMHNLAFALTHTKNEDYLKITAVSSIINYLWLEAQPFLRIMALIYSLFMILLSADVAIDDRNLGLEVVVVCLALGLVGSEAIQMWKLGRHYLNIWNIADLTTLLLTIIFFIIRFAGAGDVFMQQSFFSVILIFGYVRWISFLRIFDATRKLLSHLLETNLTRKPDTDYHHHPQRHDWIYCYYCLHPDWILPHFLAV